MLRHFWPRLLSYAKLLFDHGRREQPNLTDFFIEEAAGVTLLLKGIVCSEYDSSLWGRRSRSPSKPPRRHTWLTNAASLDLHPRKYWESVTTQSIQPNERLDLLELSICAWDVCDHYCCKLLPMTIGMHNLIDINIARATSLCPCCLALCSGSACASGIS